MSQKYNVIDQTSALPADVLFELQELDSRYFPLPWSRDAWGNIYSEGIDHIIILDKFDGTIRGFILLSFNLVDSFSHLLKILVAPKFRGLKIAKNLLNEAVRVLKERGIETFFLEVEEENVIALKLYESMGFKIIHKKKHFYSNGSTAIIMTLGI